MAHRGPPGDRERPQAADAAPEHSDRARAEQADQGSGRPPGHRPPDGLSRRAALVAALIGGVMAVVGSIVAALVVAVLSGLMQERPAEEVLTSLPVLGTSIVVTSAVLLLTALLAPALARLGLRDALGLRGAPVTAFVLAPVGMMALGPVSDLLVQAMEAVAPDMTFGGLETLHALALEHPLWLLFPIVALMPGIAEELFFRGMLQRPFGRGAGAITLSALAFSLFHLDPHHVAGVLPLGFYLAWLAAATRSTWVPVVAHVFNNTVALVAPRIAPLDVGYGTEEPIPVWWALVGLVIALLTAWVIRARARVPRVPRVRRVRRAR